MSTVLEPELDTRRHPIKRGEPAWDLALLFPPQGEWTEEEYLGLRTNRLVELVDGCLEVLPMPIPLHQFIVRYLFRLLDAYVTARLLGDVLFAPLPVRLRLRRRQSCRGTAAATSAASSTCNRRNEWSMLAMCAALSCRPPRGCFDRRGAFDGRPEEGSL